MGSVCSGDLPHENYPPPIRFLRQVLHADINDETATSHNSLATTIKVMSYNVLAD